MSASATATIRRDLYAAPVRLYRLVRRTLRFLQVPRALLLLFTVVVTLNLTLICQGHETSNGHTGPHITLLFGSLNAHATSLVQAHEHSAHAVHSGHVQAPVTIAHPAQTPSKTALYATGANTVAASQTAQADAFGLSLLGLASLLFSPLSVLRSRSLSRLADVLLKSQLSAKPDFPPPRISA